MKILGSIIAVFGAFCTYAAASWPTLSHTETGNTLSILGIILMISGISVFCMKKKKK